MKNKEKFDRLLAKVKCAQFQMIANDQGCITCDSVYRYDKAVRDHQKAYDALLDMLREAREEGYKAGYKQGDTDQYSK